MTYYSHILRSTLLLCMHVLIAYVNWLLFAEKDTTGVHGLYQ